MDLWILNSPIYSGSTLNRCLSESYTRREFFHRWVRLLAVSCSFMTSASLLSCLLDELWTFSVYRYGLGMFQVQVYSGECLQDDNSLSMVVLVSVNALPGTVASKAIGWVGYILSMADDYLYTDASYCSCLWIWFSLIGDCKRVKQDHILCCELYWHFSLKQESLLLPTSLDTYSSFLKQVEWLLLLGN